MKITTYKGREEQLSRTTVLRSLPNESIRMIGSIAFIDHIIEKNFEPQQPKLPDGKFAHPHRGIATFTYLLEGQLEHFDSFGGHGKVEKGGLQWMKAGNGVIHDEFFPMDFQKSGGLFHGLQLWINLPEKEKNKNPEYQSLSINEIPEITFEDNLGKLRVLLGDYFGHKSSITNYSDQNIYHLTLEEEGDITLPIKKGNEYGVYTINGSLVLNSNELIPEKRLAFIEDLGETVHLSNKGKEKIELIFFGGEPYTENIVSYGPFIMNSQKGILNAFQDFEEGKYGEIDYSDVFQSKD